MSRRDIYYWKCDRPAAFHGTEAKRSQPMQIEQQLVETLKQRSIGSDIRLAPSGSQGNHLTWNALVDGRELFLRVEDGPEADAHLEVESSVIRLVAATGVPVPRIHDVDARRSEVPFAWQLMDRIPHPDLNQWFKSGELAVERIAYEIGAAVARWQSIELSGFGPLELDNGRFQGVHSHYESYFSTRLDQHLRFLQDKSFFTSEQSAEIQATIDANRDLLALAEGCLVHKDLALWNILGSTTHIAAFIDFDDAIIGDSMDDLSLLACFHDSTFLQRAFAGYQSCRPLPTEHRRRFWLHLLRNMLVKAVIRVGAGYFDRDDGFFLIGSGSSGSDLKRFTLARIDKALQCLRQDADIDAL